MKHINLFISIIIAISLINSSGCKKEEQVQDPILSINSPEQGSHIYIPGTVVIDFSINNSDNVNYIRVSIDNSDIIPMTKQEYIEPESSDTSFTLELTVDAVTTENFKPPYYVHIAIDNGSLHHYYSELDVSIRDQEFIGLAVSGKTGLQSSKIDIYNNVYTLDSSLIINGNITNLCANNYTSSIYISTELPEKIINISLPKLEINWEKESAAVYPGYNTIVDMNDIVYASTNDGRIIGLRSNGNQSFTTLPLSDSVPEKFCITDDFIITNLNLRGSQDKFLQSYYLASGNRFSKYSFEGNTIGIEALSNNRALIFSNFNSSGLLVVFDIEDNYIVSSLATGIIKAICKKSDNEYLYASDQEIILYNYLNNTISIIGSIEGTISEIKFEKNNNLMIITFDNNIKIFSYPQLQLLHTIDLQISNCSTDILYSY